eukprot:122626-Pelagomonas_calceolata.AAC.1
MQERISNLHAQNTSLNSYIAEYEGMPATAHHLMEFIGCRWPSTTRSRCRLSPSWCSAQGTPLTTAPWRSAPSPAYETARSESAIILYKQYRKDGLSYKIIIKVAKKTVIQKAMLDVE